MSETSVATEQINSFGRLLEVDAQPSDDPVFVLTCSELKAIISAAVTEALKTALERVSDLESDITTLKTEIVDIRASGEAEITRVCEDIAFDRRRISAVEQSRTAPLTPPGEKTADRIEQIKSILKSRGATSFGELEHILKISPREMLRITKRLDLRYFEIMRRPGDARQKVLRLRAQIK